MAEKEPEQIIETRQEVGGQVHPIPEFDEVNVRTSPGVEQIAEGQLDRPFLPPEQLPVPYDSSVVEVSKTFEGVSTPPYDDEQAIAGRVSDVEYGTNNDPVLAETPNVQLDSRDRVPEGNLVAKPFPPRHDQAGYIANAGDPALVVTGRNRKNWYLTDELPFVAEVTAVAAGVATVKRKSISGNPASAAPTLADLLDKDGSLVTYSYVKILKPNAAYSDFAVGDTVWVEKRGRYYFATAPPHASSGVSPIDIEGDDIWVEVDAPADNEDFTTYTETDPSSLITVTSSTIAWDDLADGEDAYVYKDYTAGYFDGDFTFTIACRRREENSERPLILGLSNVVDDWKNWRDDNHEAWAIAWSGSLKIRLTECEGDTSDTSSTIALNAWYYLHVVRSGDTLTVNIYTDSSRIVLHDTITRTLPTGRSYRYVFALSSYNAGGGTRAGSGDVKDLNLNPKFIINSIWPASEPAGLVEGLAESGPTDPCVVDNHRVHKGNLYAYHKGQAGWYIAETNTLIDEYTATGGTCAGDYHQQWLSLWQGQKQYWESGNYYLDYNGTEWEISDAEFAGVGKTEHWTRDVAGIGEIEGDYTKILGAGVGTTVAAA